MPRGAWLSLLLLLLVVEAVDSSSSSASYPPQPLYSLRAYLSWQVGEQELDVLDVFDAQEEQGSLQEESSPPLLFERNLGQAPSDVAFVTRAKGYVASIAGDSSFTMAFGGCSFVRQTYLGSRKNQELIFGGHLSTTRINYFLGNNASRWQTNVPTYVKLHGKDLYSGVDIIYQGSSRYFSYEFHVKNATLVDQIVMHLETSPSVTSIDVIDDQLVILLSKEGKIIHSKPIFYQLLPKEMQCIQVIGGFKVTRENLVSFSLDFTSLVDPTLPLVIDPVIFATYFGGTATDKAFDLKIDPSGNVYVTGETNSPDFPTTTGPFLSTGAETTSNGFITKFNSDASQVIYTTFFGGSGTADYGRGLTIDGFGNVFIAGCTDSSDFPLMLPLQAAYRGGLSDGFIIKLNSDGNAILFSTYFGGSGEDIFVDIVIDVTGVYVTGNTKSLDYNSTSPASIANGGSGDWVVTKLDLPGSSLLYSRILGSPLGPSDGRPSVIRFDTTAPGRVYIAGGAGGAFPVTSGSPVFGGGASDGAVVRLDCTNDTILYAKFIGGSGDDLIQDVTLDETSGAMYVVGWTSSADFPGTGGGRSWSGGVDAFLSKVNSATGQFMTSVYVGGNQIDEAHSVTISSSGKLTCMTGTTSSLNFPLMNPDSSSLRGTSDAFVTCLSIDSNGILWTYSSYYGGSNDESGNAIQFSDDNNLIITGYTNSPDLVPPTIPALNRTLNGAEDIFLSKISISTPTFPPQSSTPTTGLQVLASQPITRIGDFILPGQVYVSLDLIPNQQDPLIRVSQLATLSANSILASEIDGNFSTITVIDPKGCTITGEQQRSENTLSVLLLVPKSCHEGNGRLSTAAIAGIVVGVIIALAIIALALAFFIRSRRPLHRLFHSRGDSDEWSIK